MERKNMVLLTVIAVATLLVAVVGATFAYFTATVNNQFDSNGDEGKTNITAGQVAGETSITTATGVAGSFEKEDIYPGHKEVAGIKVNVKTTKDTSTNTIKLVWKGNSTFTTDLKVNVYRTTTDVDGVEFTCTKATGAGTGADDGKTTYYETCNELPEDVTSGEHVATDLKITNSTSDLTLVTESITGSTDPGKDYFYYVVIEYPNNTESTEESASQNADFGATLDGNISVEVI